MITGQVVAGMIFLRVGNICLNRRMKNLLERIHGIISGHQDSDPHHRQRHFDLVKSRKGILRELQISKESGNLVGLVSKALGGGMFLVGIKAIETQGADEIIVYQKYNFGDESLLASGRLAVRDIGALCPFLTKNRTIKVPAC